MLRLQQRLRTMHNTPSVLIYWNPKSGAFEMEDNGLPCIVDLVSNNYERLFTSMAEQPAELPSNMAGEGWASYSHDHLKKVAVRLAKLLPRQPRAPELWDGNRVSWGMASRPSQFRTKELLESFCDEAAKYLGDRAADTDMSFAHNLLLGRLQRTLATYTTPGRSSCYTLTYVTYMPGVSLCTLVRETVSVTLHRCWTREQVFLFWLCTRWFHI